MIGRKTSSKGKEYTRIWIYVPTKVSEDTAFPFGIGDPCQIEIDQEEAALSVKPLPVSRAVKEGWAMRRRRRSS